MTVASLSLVFLTAALSGCSGGSTGSGPQPREEDAGQVATMAAPAEGIGVSAFSGIEAADEVASGWQGDAELYAIAAATPRLGANGESPSWLYTYVSESAGSVASVAYSEGAGANLDPAQELPEADIEYIAENALPDEAEMLDSTEAIAEAGEVAAALEEDPELQASAGLDSFSGDGAEWIFATARGEDRVEERVPAGGGA